MWVTFDTVTPSIPPASRNEEGAENGDVDLLVSDYGAGIRLFGEE